VKPAKTSSGDAVAWLQFEAKKGWAATIAAVSNLEAKVAQLLNAKEKEEKTDQPRGT
jgi:hypothetical protein